MTDSTSWQPPAGPTPAQPASPYAPPQAVPPQFAPPGGAPLAGPPVAVPPPGWTPPPKPGLIPLRPLTLGTLLGAAFQVLRRNPRPTFGFSLLVTSGIFVLTIVLVGLVTVYAFSRTTLATGSDLETLEAGSIAMLILAALVPGAFSIIATAMLQGVISLEVARATLGEKLRLGGLWRAARGRIGALIGWSLLVSLAVVVALAVVVGIITLIAVTGGTAGAIAAVLLGLVAALGFVVVALWLSTRLALVPSVLMIERLPLREAVPRAWRLTHGFFWKTLGITLLVAFIISTATSVVSFPLQVVPMFGAGLFNPNGEQSAGFVIVIIVYLLSIVVTLVFSALAAVVQSATPALLYIDYRMRREGLDLELSRFVEAREAGDRSVTDPYLRAPATGTTTGESPWS